MFLLSHLETGRFFAKQLRSMENPDFRISSIAFIYGNIKPDVTRLVMLNHHIEETYSIYLENLQIALCQTESKRNRSIAFGVVTHFLCDYFCMYHGKEPYKADSLLKHLWYELRLHTAYVLTLIKVTLNNKSINNPMEHIVLDTIKENDNKVHQEYISGIRQMNMDVGNIDINLSLLLDVYLKQDDGVKVDMDFVLYSINEAFGLVMGLKPLNVFREKVFLQVNNRTKIEAELDNKVVA